MTQTILNGQNYGSPARLRLTAVDDVGEVVGGGVDAHCGPLVVSYPLQRETLLRILPQETPAEAKK